MAQNNGGFGHYANNNHTYTQNTAGHWVNGVWVPGQPSNRRGSTSSESTVFSDTSITSSRTAASQHNPQPGNQGQQQQGGPPHLNVAGFQFPAPPHGRGFLAQAQAQAQAQQQQQGGRGRGQQPQQGGQAGQQHQQQQQQQPQQGQQQPQQGQGGYGRGGYGYGQQQPPARGGRGRGY